MLQWWWRLFALPVASSFFVKGYFPDFAIYAHKYTPADLPSSGLSHVLYAFMIPNPSPADYAVIKTHSVYPPTGYSTQLPEGTLVPYDMYAWSVNRPALAKLGAGIKRIVSVGGWSGSWHLSHILSNATTRARFVESTAVWIQTEGWYGLDLDWEFPGVAGQPWNAFSAATDAASLTSFCKEFRARVGSGIEFTLAVSGAHPDIMARYSGCQPWVDAVHVMAYDYYGPWNPQSAPHSAFVASPRLASMSEYNAQYAMNQYLGLGWKPSQVLLGIPFYGRGWKGCSLVGDPLFSLCTGGPAPTLDPTGGGEPGASNYRYLTTLAANGYSVVDTPTWSYAYRAGTLWVYDSPAVVRYKTQQARQQGWGGVFIWDMSADDGTLFAATRWNCTNCRCI